MTLGSSPTPAQILAELGESFPYTFPDAKTRWLADVGASAPITFPTSFANKQSIKIVDTVVQTNTVTGSRTFSGVNFGLAFTGRVLVACVMNYRNANENLNITGGTIGGDASTTGRVSFENTPSNSCAVGIISADAASGTSGSVVITHNGTATHCGLIMLSIASIAQATHDYDITNGGGSGGTSTGTLTLNIPANGILLQVAGHANTNNTTMSGVTERTEITVGGGRLAVGFDNRKGAQTGDTTSASWSGTVSYAAVAASWAQ